MDVVLTAFACSKTSPCAQWAKAYFADPPAVVWVPGANSTQFEAVGKAAAADLPAWAAAHAGCGPGDVGRIAIVTFSAGWGFAYQVLRGKGADCVDALVILDGYHTRDLEPGKRFAVLASAGEALSPMLVMAHTQIVPPFISSTESNAAIFQAAREACPNSDPKPAPEYVSEAQLAGPVTCGNDGCGYRTFARDPFLSQDNVGSAWMFGYAGKDGPAHCYVAAHVAPRMWRMLGERWNDPALGLRCNLCG